MWVARRSGFRLGGRNDGLRTLGHRGGSRRLSVFPSISPFESLRQAKGERAD